MKIQGFKIERFARPELTSGGPIKLQDVSDEDILIRGENQSGKTHTFNALLYSLLGETIALQRGHGNAVELHLSSGLEIFRGEPGKKVHFEGQEFGPDKAEAVIRDRVGSRDLLHTHFLHSRLSELPLEKLPQSERVSRVLNATSDNLSDRIQELEEQVKELQANIERKEAEQNSKERDRDRRLRQRSDIQSQLEKWSMVEGLAESGRLAEISDALQDDPELERQISELTSEKRSLITDIREKQNERTRAKELEEETRKIIIKALEEFICPVCEERVGRGEADSRLDNQQCPFCNQSTDVRETFRHLETEKQQSEGQLEEINREIRELRERKDEVDSQILSLKEERPEIADLNSYAVDQLRDFDHDIDSIHTKAREERVEAEEALEEYSDKLENVEAAITELEEKISDLEEARESKQDRIEQLENQDVSTKLSDFEETWNHHYQRITPEIAEEIHLQRDGEIVLVNDDGRSREYDRRGDLADAEVVLLNISFVITLNQIALDRGSIDWETIVLDEPFARLDRGLKEDAMSYLRSLDTQFILTSSDEYIWQEFNHATTLSLQRQYKITDFADD